MIQLPFAVYRVVIYVIFSGHILVALSASEASFILVAKKITRISHVVCWIPTMPQRYEHQILYMHFAAHHAHTHTHVYVEEVPRRRRFACDRSVAVSEKQVSAV